MIILGIDPGLATMGFGVIETERGASKVVDYGVVLTPKEETLPVRLALLEEGVQKLAAKFKPDEIALEELFFNNNITTGINVAQSRGVILLAVQQAGVPIFEYKPMQVKQAVVGYGNASKHQVMDMTKRILHLSAVPKPDDAADAVAIALCHARSSTSLLAAAQKK